MNKRANKTKASSRRPSPARAVGHETPQTFQGMFVPEVRSRLRSEADPHDPLLVLVRHTYAQRVCHPHGG